MIIKENLQYALLGNFSYGWLEIQEFRSLIPKQCSLKGECKIGLLSNRYVLIRVSLLEDYVNLLSKLIFYITHRGWSYLMRTLKWDPLFDPQEETTTAIAWISFPELPPNYFIKEVIFSLASAVGKRLQVDMAMKNQSRPSCARVKMEVALLSDIPKMIKIRVKKQSTGEVVEKWIRIKYDYVPKYYTTCKLQGHDERAYYIVHAELYPKEDKDNKDKVLEGERKDDKGKGTDIKGQQNGDEQIFNKHRLKNGFGKGVQQKRTGVIQQWNKKIRPHEKGVVTTVNKFTALMWKKDKVKQRHRKRTMLGRKKIKGKK
ncbi:hypothetical protein R3W88_024687 [Solanum pinnatisectum]|uniref:DUF4283 domain-containing protein n=1 Tax=Solanum pinnatisectum TaxID=50273 RepID=A0AAV9M337_9SOLN|nr:hypothetical protein R3W88_024687 [Solanum pinnatisectum]